MDGVEVSVMRWSSTIINVSPCTRPSCVFFYSQSFLWASASEPAGSVPTTQSQKREVGTIAL